MIRVKNVSAYLDEPFILRMRVVPRVNRYLRLFLETEIFYVTGNFVLLPQNPQNHESCLIKKKEEYHGRTL